MRKIVYFLFIILAVNFAGLAKEYSPQDIKNPNIADRRQYVADPEDLVSSRAKSEASAILWNLRQKTGVEVAEVIIPNTGEYTKEEFATRLFDNWKIGKSDKDNGVLILIVTDQREAWIATGYGVEGVIPDISATKIVNRSIVPYMKQGNLNEAVVAVAADVANILSNPEAASELKSNEAERWNQASETDITGDDILAFALSIIVFMGLGSYIIYFYEKNRLKHRDRYNQSRAWQDNMNLFLIIAIVSAGLGLPAYLMAKRRYRKLRNDPMKCPACKGEMKKLNEEEDNNLLSPSQDLEEQLNSVDYDVWVCNDCGTVERYAFPNKHSIYQECPNCHTKAMYMVKDHTIVPATTRSNGIGEKLYDCKYCHNQTRKRYNIPKKEDGTAAALAAGAILGSGRGMGGGGSFGGGFGGGRTGGGGGGGRW
ncbi:MAG: TPM domain-containing protein [Muribaculaceae bacterium]|nr:TPM domain-containing protein [Muribaculaceae bacterium]